MDMPAPSLPPLSSDLPGIVDCDVHPLFADGIRSLYPYMPDAWVQRFVRKRAHLAGGGLTLRYGHPNGTVVRDDVAVVRLGARVPSTQSGAARAIAYGS